MTDGGERRTSDERPPRGVDGPVPGKSGSGTSPGAYAGLGLQFAVSIILFVYLGNWADRKFGTAPVFLLVALFVGAGASFYAMVRRLNADQKRADEAARDARRGKR